MYPSKASLGLTKLAFLLLLGSIIGGGSLWTVARPMNGGHGEAHEGSSHLGFMNDYSDMHNWLTLATGDPYSSVPSVYQRGEGSTHDKDNAHHSATAGHNYGYPHYGQPTYEHTGIKMTSHPMYDQQHGQVQQDQQLREQALNWQAYPHLYSNRRQQQSEEEEGRLWNKMMSKATTREQQRYLWNEKFHGSRPLPLLLFSKEEAKRMSICQNTERFFITAYLENLELQKEGIDVGIDVSIPTTIERVEPRFTPLTSKGPIEPELAEKQYQLDLLLQKYGFLRGETYDQIQQFEEEEEVKSKPRGERVLLKTMERSKWEKNHPGHLYPVRLMTPQELNLIGLAPATLPYRMARYLEEDYYKRFQKELWGGKELKKPNLVPLPRSLAKSFPQPIGSFGHEKQQQMDHILRMYDKIKE